MSKKSNIEHLPNDIQEQLVRQYLELPAWTLDDHVTWLAERGISVSRSSLQRFFFNRKETLLQAQAQREEAVQAEQGIRLRCLEIAARLYKGDDQSELIGLAEDLIDWIGTTDASRLTLESFCSE